VQIVINDDMEDSLVKLSCEINLEPKFRPLLQYLHQQGLSETDFRKIAERHKTCLQTNAVMAKERVEYLLSVGVESDNLSKLIVRHPQILEYTVERAMKPRIQYLKRLGVPESKLGRVITVAPSLLECSLHRSLKPRVEYLKDVVGIKDSDIGLIVTRSPQVGPHSLQTCLFCVSIMSVVMSAQLC
jgi:mTERF domain-containing protein